MDCLNIMKSYSSLNLCGSIRIIRLLNVNFIHIEYSIFKKKMRIVNILNKSIFYQIIISDCLDENLKLFMIHQSLYKYINCHASSVTSHL